MDIIKIDTATRKVLIQLLKGNINKSDALQIEAFFEKNNLIKKELQLTDEQVKMLVELL
jgi:predicted metallo-beta-lactamase superfamily hydrolase